MPETPYIIAVLAIVFTVTLGLRALPFAALRSLRESVLVGKLSVWMPVGILGILAVSTLRNTLTADPGNALPAAVAVAVTVVHISSAGGAPCLASDWERWRTLSW